MAKEVISFPIEAPINQVKQACRTERFHAHWLSKHHTLPSFKETNAKQTEVTLKGYHRVIHYQKKMLEEDFKHLALYQDKKKYKILISGGTGFIGGNIKAFLQLAGHEVYVLSRRSSSDLNEIFWNPERALIPIDQLEGFHCMIHLCGENIARRWNAKKKEKIYHSRVDYTRFLVDSLNRLKMPPEVLICASADGYYGAHPNEEVDESSPAGEDFLSRVCVNWEAQANKALVKRCVKTRFSMVMHPSGGALKQMLTPFKIGLGGNLGSGEQYTSWIALEDLIYQMHHIIYQETIHGPINFSNGSATQNKSLTEVLGKLLQRPTFCNIPTWLLKCIFGEMASLVLLADKKVKPTKLLQEGIPFVYNDVDHYLRYVLGKEMVDET